MKPNTGDGLSINSENNRRDALHRKNKLQFDFSINAFYPSYDTGNHCKTPGDDDKKSWGIENGHTQFNQ